MSSTIPPPPDASFANLDTIIAALAEPGTNEEDRRRYLRASIRCIQFILGNAEVRMGAIADALTVKGAS
jgi:hypothetical protein